MKRLLLVALVLLSLGAPALQASGRTVTVSGTDGNDVLVVTATGPDRGIYRLNEGPAVAFNRATSFSFAAGAGDDLLRVIHPAGTVFAPVGGIDYDGGGDFDVLDVVGGGDASKGTYTPGDTPDSGTITYATGGLKSSLAFTGIEPTTVSGMASFTLTTPSSDDVLTVDSPAAGQNRVSGTSGGVAFESVTFFDVTNFTVAAGTNDGASPDDTLTIDASGLVATGLQNFIFNSGAGNDSMTILSTSYTLPVAGGNISFNGGSGTADKFIGNANIGYTLADSGVTSSAGGTVAFTAVEQADLTGGAGANTFTINATAILANLNGGVGNDTFTFANGAGVGTGTIDGGDDTDLLNYTAYTSAMAVNLGLSTTGLSATLGADQEVPPTTSIATGTATVTNYNHVAKTFDISVAVDGIPAADVTGFHIHRAAVGVNGPIIVDFGTGGIVPTANGFTFSTTGVPLGALHEAAFLGGITYLNVHNAAFPGGVIRGQIFTNGNVNLVSGTATGTGSVTGIENVTGGSGSFTVSGTPFGDSLVGSNTGNLLNGGPGNDVLVGAPGGDTLNGDAGADVLVWSNGDGTDAMNGGTENDTVQVNGSVTADDSFTTGAGTGGRVAFARLSPGPFTLDIGTVETLTVNGIDGNDTFTVNSLAGVSDLTSLNLNGLNGTDSFSVTVAPPGGIALTIRGGNQSDTLIGPNVPSIWNITAANQGNIPGAVTSFVNVENLTGGSDADNFLFEDGDSVAGTIDGLGGVDLLDYTAYTSALAVNLGLSTTGLVATLGPDQENPPTTSPGTGTASITNYNLVARTFDISVTVDGIPAANVTGFHIHRGAVGVNGPIIVDFGTGGIVANPNGFTFNATGVPLDARHEAAFLGGITYLNVHNATFPGGAIRGQIFSNGNVNLVSGTATGTGSVTGIENVNGGSGSFTVSGTPFGDSLVGSNTGNLLNGGPGNDVLVGAPGGDTLNGDAGADVLVWSNGDGTDLMNGGTENDLVQVNGSLSAADTLTVGAGAGGRINFARISPGPFTLDIGTAETLTVNGIDGADTFTVNSLAGVTDLTSVNLNGLNDADTFIVAVAPPVGIALNIRGGNQSDSLTGLDAPNVWNITGINQGNIPGSVTSFVNVENLTGGLDADNFVFEDGDSVTGIIGGGSGTDLLDYTAYTSPLAVNLGLSTTGLSATLGPDQENPPTTSPGTGTATLTNYNPVARTFDISVTVEGIPAANVTGFHIHRGAVGVNGPIIVDFGTGGLVTTANGFTFNATSVPLDARHEAAFLGGITYLNVHNSTFPGGAIRGQIFSNGNVNLTSGTATGSGSVTGIENVNGGSGSFTVSGTPFGDSLVGSNTGNVLNGGPGNDTLVGAPGADTFNGDAGLDILVWSNGDGTDLMNGGTESDTVQVNGSLAADDNFSIGAGSGGRVAFNRISPGPFGLDIGTVETLTVNGIDGADTLTLNSLVGVADLSLIRLNGLNGNDTFNVTPAPNGVTRLINVNGGVPEVFGDVLNIDQTGVSNPVLTIDQSGDGTFTSSSHQTINITGIEPTATPTPTPTPTPTATPTPTPTPVPPSLQWSSATYSGNENAGSVTLTVTRTGDTSQQAVVHYSTNNGSATAGSDYVATSGDLTFAPGDTSKNVVVTILDDSASEGNETFTALLTAVAGAPVGTPQTTTVTIVDNEPAPTPTPTATPSPTATATPTPTPTGPAQTVNLSTRMLVQTGDSVGIGGFISTGSTPKHVLLRAIGPSLSGFGITNSLADPVLELHGPTGFVTITNDNWRDTQEAQIQASGIPPSNDLESAIDATLPPANYTAVVRGKDNTTGVALVEIFDLDQPPISKLGNISTRAFVSTGDEIIIGGFILGNAGGADRIVARGLGPSLTASGVPNVLANPTLELRDSNGTLLIANDNWQDNPAQAAEISAAGLAPSDPLESAIAATLPPGPYTALLRGVDNGTGNGLVEVYDRGGL